SPLKILKQDLLVRHLCHEIAVEHLEESDIADYLAKTFAVDTLPEGLPAMIHQHSGGNPLFMAAIVQDMANKNLIVHERKRLLLTAPLREVDPGVPETLQQMLEIQVELLSPEEQRILEGCSVGGERFSVWATAEILEMSPVLIEEVCDRLAKRRQFLRSAG